MGISYPVTFLIKTTSGDLIHIMKAIQFIQENHPNAKISIEVDCNSLFVNFNRS